MEEFRDIIELSSTYHLLELGNLQLSVKKLQIPVSYLLNPRRRWYPGAKFTEDLRIILRQFSHLRSSEGNDLIHRTLMTCLKSDRCCESLRHVL